MPSSTTSATTTTTSRRPTSPAPTCSSRKDLAINQEIEKLRLHTTSTLLSGRRDVIVVASVSCIYGIGNPEEFAKNVIFLKPGMRYTRNALLYQFVQILYSRTEVEFTRGSFRVKGDTVDVFPAYADYAIRLYFFGDEIESVHKIDPVSGKKLSDEPTALPCTRPTCS